MQQQQQQHENTHANWHNKLNERRKITLFSMDLSTYARFLAIFMDFSTLCLVSNLSAQFPFTVDEYLRVSLLMLLFSLLVVNLTMQQQQQQQEYE